MPPSTYRKAHHGRNDWLAEAREGVGQVSEELPFVSLGL